MTGEARYAVYFAPDPASALWLFGSAVIGYDAATGSEVPLLVPPGWHAADWRAATAEPRRYGFHATLKAPFRLAEGVTEADLLTALPAFARARAAPAPARLEVSLLGSFVALTPAATVPGLAALEAAIVAGFDRFRAPLTPEERERRKPATLSPRQLRSLDRWGYPYVLDDFRFHMTLTGPLQPDRAVATRDALAVLAAERGLDAAVAIDRIALFRQGAGAEGFTAVAAALLTGTDSPGS